MGLDITAYRQVKRVENAQLDQDGQPVDWQSHQLVYINNNFPGRAEGIEDKAVYDYGTESIDFRAGSYRGYNVWRNELAKLAGYPPCADDPNYPNTHAQGAWKASSGPFWELINFADNEGVIGPVVGAKLAKDFEQFEPIAQHHSEPFFYDRYKEWRKAFELAADGGFVSFH